MRVDHRGELGLVPSRADRGRKHIRKGPAMEVARIPSRCLDGRRDPEGELHELKVAQRISTFGARPDIGRFETVSTIQ
jgi:hypothetical protein